MRPTASIYYKGRQVRVNIAWIIIRPIQVAVNLAAVASASAASLGVEYNEKKAVVALSAILFVLVVAAVIQFF